MLKSARKLKPAVKYAAIPAILAVAVFLYTYRSRQEGLLFPRSGSASLPQSVIENRLKNTEEKLARKPGDLKAIVDRGVLYFSMGPEHYADALNSFNAAWQAGAFDERIFYYSGILYENLSLFDEAQKQYDRFLRHVPGDREVRLRLARLLFRVGKWEDSIQQYQEFLQENDKDITSMINCGLAYRKKAEIILQPGKKLTAEQKNEAQSDIDQSINYLESAVKIDPNLPEGVYLAMADLYFGKGDWEKAVSACEFEIQKSTQSELLQIMAASCEKLNRNDKALEYYMKISRQQPQNAVWARKVRALKKLPAKKA